jgi:hypothetical protein
VHRRPDPSVAGCALALAAAALVTAAPARADPPSLYAAGPPVPAATPASSADSVRVVSDDPRVVLERRAAPAAGPPLPGVYAEPRWELACGLPCLAPLPLDGVYRVAGEGVTPTDAFMLPGSAAQLRVSAGSRSLRRAGIILAIAGLVVAAASAGVLASAGLHPTDPQTGKLDVGTVAAIATLSAGGVMGGAGLTLALVNGTSVHDERGRSLALGAPTLLHATFSF